jgi:cytochrome c biogenesis protein CcmG/thiol:disulfide interchange protein DsbE
MADSLSYLEPSERTKRGRPSLTAIALIIGAMVVVIMLGISLARAGQTQPASGPAPNFTLGTFDGDLFSLADQRGKVVIVNFWASWCVPCREEAPILQDVWERYRDRDVVMVGVDYLDVERDALAFIEEFGITYPNGLDMGKAISKRYRIKGVPETFIVDQKGDIVEFYVGPAKEGQLDAILEPLLGTQVG